MPSKSANVKNAKQYEALKDKVMSTRQRAATGAGRPSTGTAAAGTGGREAARGSGELAGRHHSRLD